VLTAEVLRRDGCEGVVVCSTRLPTASPHGERERTSALVLLSNLDSFSRFTGNVIVFLAIRRNESQGELGIRHAPSHLQCPVLP